MKENKDFKERNIQFKWRTKQDLYTDFKERYGLLERHVDEEIKKVMADFKVRKYQPIQTQELWQKVGTNLEKKFGA